MPGSIVTVKTQNELDQALASAAEVIYIESPRGVWLTLSQSGSATVEASGSATVRASGSATVRAYDSATVEAYGSATVRAYDSATVRAYDSATVEAYDSATVRAYDSATVRAYDSATVRAYDSATVTASKFVAVHLFSKRVTIAGGVVIDITDIDMTDPLTWCEYHGIEVQDRIAFVYKAVDQNYRSHHGADYPPGATPEALDWKPTRECGNGLHFGYTPQRALDDAACYIENPRFLKCGISLDEAVVIDRKIKARRVVVACVEVDRNAEPVAAEVPA